VGVKGWGNGPMNNDKGWVGVTFRVGERGLAAWRSRWLRRP
jgi:hypothetical protein